MLLFCQAQRFVLMLRCCYVGVNVDDIGARLMASFLANRTNSCDYATVLHLSVICRRRPLSSVWNVLWLNG